jgi:hypothetical protein
VKQKYKNLILKAIIKEEAFDTVNLIISAMEEVDALTIMRCANYGIKEMDE